MGYQSFQFVYLADLSTGASQRWGILLDLLTFFAGPIQ
ncbi:MAG: hypothetical protein OFPII_26910 [Osedax symbiont Rs1]|nr:MAG: hypothetical protein OFPII_26910 [Osedax symbiont Rs1]